MPTHRAALEEATYRQLLDSPPNVAVLPWGATEAHNYHLPHGTDTMQAKAIATRAVERANAQGARAITLPAVPFGNNAQQLDQVATIHLSTLTAGHLLSDIVASLKAQGIVRLVIVNAHGGNEFKPLVRDLTHRHGVFIAVVNFFQLCPDQCAEIFEEPGDHAGELETSLILHLHPDLVQLEQAGLGASLPFELPGLSGPGVWTPRPWSRCQPDTGAGNPVAATREKGEAFFEIITSEVGELVRSVSVAEAGTSPISDET